MQIFINIAVSFVLSFWPIMFMMSPMMFDAPGSDNDKNNIMIMMLVMCYPVGLFLIMGVFGLPYFGMNGLKLAAVSTLVIAFAFSIFGYYGILFNALKGIANSGYSVVENHVYYDGKPMESADSKTFVIPDPGEHRYFYTDYAWDNLHLYYDAKVVKDALAEEIFEVDKSHGNYWHNKKQVIYGDKVLTGVTPENFRMIDNSTGWAGYDNGQDFIVFISGKRLPVVDRESFKLLNESYAKDKNSIFYMNETILPGADSASFELLEDNDFARDKDYVYFLSAKQPVIIKGADPASFKVFERGGYARDKNHIYYIEEYDIVETMEQVDVASFEATSYDDVHKSDAQDVKHYYLDGKVVGDR